MDKRAEHVLRRTVKVIGHLKESDLTVRPKEVYGELVGIFTQALMALTEPPEIKVKVRATDEFTPAINAAMAGLKAERQMRRAIRRAKQVVAAIAALVAGMITGFALAAFGWWG